MSTSSHVSNIVSGIVVVVVVVAAGIRNAFESAFLYEMSVNRALPECANRRGTYLCVEMCDKHTHMSGRCTTRRHISVTSKEVRGLRKGTLCIARVPLTFSPIRRHAPMTSTAIYRAWRLLVA